jgi:DNA replication and repair protein RecF
MILKQIDLQNFRLHKNTSLKFSDNLNLIVGGNGQGKTSILEAIYYLCTSKNLNSSADNEVVSFGLSKFQINGKFEDLSNHETAVFYETEKNKKIFYLDDKQIFNLSSVIGKFPVVSLIQNDHAITQGGPADRRRFVDATISLASSTYLGILLEYNRKLRQRSSILSQLKETRNHILYQQLDLWTETLITTGAEIIKHRTKFVNEFNFFLKEAYGNIIENLEDPLIVYQTDSKIINDSAAESLRQEFNKFRDDELRRGVNLVGPHRDDFIFFINNLELKKFGSQGQHKTFQIALKFGQFFFIKEKLGRTPIFLMDDVFGELDTTRAMQISGYLSKIGQAFITATDFVKTETLGIKEEKKIIKVNNGTVSYAS